MLCLSLEAGEAVQIGDTPDGGALVTVRQKTGRRVSLAIATNLKVDRLAPGVIPRNFAIGITGVAHPKLASTG